MILGFKARFVAPIELRTKVQSIRKPRKGRDWRRGDLIHMQQGDRFHPVRMGLGRALVVEPIVLNFATDMVLGCTAFVPSGHGWRAIKTALDLDRFAVMDGFADWADLRQFWADTHAEHVFGGNRIYWGDTFAPPGEPTPAAILA